MLLLYDQRNSDMKNNKTAASKNTMIKIGQIEQ